MQYKVTTSLLAASLMILGVSWAAAVDQWPDTQWPDTGQTICYDSVGNEVKCDGSEGYPGQDGAYGGPARGYDTTTEAGTVIDNVTGLQWHNPDPAQEEPLSYNDTASYVDVLNSSPGHEDWRIPTAQEMATLIDASNQPYTSGKYGDFFMPSPPPGNDAIYWTQTISPNDDSQKMVVRFRQGDINDGAGPPNGGPDFGGVAYVRPVRDVAPK